MLVSFINSESGKPVGVDPEQVSLVEYVNYDKSANLTLRHGKVVSVSGSFSEILARLNGIDYPSPSDPTLINVVCASCGEDHEFHRMNWSGGLNCPSGLTRWEPTIKAA